MYSCGPLHIDEQRQDDQLEPTYNSSVPIQDVALKTYRELRTIEKGNGRGSGRSALAARHDDDDINLTSEYEHVSVQKIKSARCVIYHIEIKVHIAYGMDTLKTGFNKTGFNK